MRGEFTPKQVRHIFFEREGERCFRCRRRLQFHERGYGWSLHHRQPRGMGGTRHAMDMANGIVLCGHATSPDGCHHWVESRRAIAEDYGYIVRRGINPPAGIRIKRFDGTWWLLTRSGLAVEVEEGREQ